LLSFKLFDIQKGNTLFQKKISLIGKKILHKDIVFKIITKTYISLTKKHIFCSLKTCKYLNHNANVANVYKINKFQLKKIYKNLHILKSSCIFALKTLIVFKEKIKKPGENHLA
jgi:hypothetical protein